MKAQGDNDNNTLGCYENKLQKERTDSKEALSIAKKILKRNLISNLRIDEQRGRPPSPLRQVGRGARGELWFRNKLLWLRTIPLEENISFTITHAEAPVYYMGNTGRNSADLLGIWCSRENTKLGVVELKAGARGDHVLYAIMEGLRNLSLHRNAIKRLHSGWSMALNKFSEGGWSNAWSSSNSFNNRLRNSHLIVIGDTSWIHAQKKWYKESVEIANIIKKNFNYETSIYSLNNCNHHSKPYVILPLTKWL